MDGERFPWWFRLVSDIYWKSLMQLWGTFRIKSINAADLQCTWLGESGSSQRKHRYFSKPARPSLPVSITPPCSPRQDPIPFHAPRIHSLQIRKLSQVRWTIHVCIKGHSNHLRWLWGLKDPHLWYFYDTEYYKGLHLGKTTSEWKAGTDAAIFFLFPLLSAW